MSHTSFRHKAVELISDIFAMCPLDECIFSSGALHRYDKRIEALPRRPNDFEITTIHANYIIGNEKQQMMKSRGLWLATQGTVTGATRYWDGVCSKLTSNHTFNAWPIPFVDDAAVKVPGSREIYLISNGNIRQDFVNCTIRISRMLLQ